MREIRTYAFEQGEPAIAWRTTRPVRLIVTAGEVWLTVEGRVDDYWLAPGQPFELPPGVRVWIGAGRGDAQVELAFAVTAPSLSERAPLRGAGSWRTRAGQAEASVPM